MQAAEFIKQIYPQNPKPFYLSRLGSILKKNSFFVANLREYVEEMEGFTVACGPERERTAIATVEDKEEVEKLLNDRASKIDNEALRFLSKLPRTLLFAFSSKSKANPNVYFMSSPPYNFGFAKENDDMLEIKRDLLIDAKIPLNLKQLSPEIVKKLHANIEKWIDDNSIDFTTDAKSRSKSLTQNRTTLLEEMLQAIPANQRSKVVLPLDIIGYLIKER